MSGHLFKEGDSAIDGHGEQYIILVVESANTDMPHLSRYKVQRSSDQGTIENFPGYLLMKPKAK